MEFRTVIKISMVVFTIGLVINFMYLLDTIQADKVDAKAYREYTNTTIKCMDSCSDLDLMYFGYNELFKNECWCWINYSYIIADVWSNKTR